MDIWQIIRIVIRRWYVFLPIVTIGAVAALMTTSGTPPQYTATFDAFVSAPASESSQPPGSVQNSGGVGFVGALEQSAMDADEVRSELKAEGLLPNYEVTWTRSELTLTVKVTGRDPDIARRTVERVVAKANQHLADYQAKTGVVSPTMQYTVKPAAPGANLDPPRYPGKSRQRFLIAAIALALATGLAVALDGLLVSRRRTRRRTRRSAAGKNGAGQSVDAAPADIPHLNGAPGHYSAGPGTAGDRDDATSRAGRDTSQIDQDTVTTADRGGPSSAAREAPHRKDLPT